MTSATTTEETTKRLTKSPRLLRSGANLRSAVRKLLASTLTRKMMAAVVFALAEHLRERVRHGP